MELNQLKYFLDVAESQHVTKSAEKMHIAQPTLTKAIHRLEEELGVPLFLPKGRNIILSEYGKYLQKRLSPILSELDHLPAQLKNMAQLEDKTVRLNVLAASALLVDAVIQYNKTHEQLNFELTQTLQSDSHDISVSTGTMQPSAMQKNQQSFTLSEKVFLAVPSSHPLAEKDTIELREAANEGFISLMGSRQFRSICDRFCYQAGFSPRIIFESDNPATVKNMIAAQMGIGFWTEFTWGKLDHTDVKLLEISNPTCQRDIFFHYTPNKLDNSITQQFFVFLKEYCEKNTYSKLK